MSYTVSEGDGFADIILNKTGSNEIPVTVSVQTTTRDDTAEGESVIDWGMNIFGFWNCTPTSYGHLNCTRIT